MAAALNRKPVDPGRRGTVSSTRPCLRRKTDMELGINRAEDKRPTQPTIFLSPLVSWLILAL